MNNKPDTENISRRSLEHDDNVSWLITFADLMTILLVFSFITYAARTEEAPGIPSPKTQIHSPSSFTSLAYANTHQKNKTTVSLPVYVPDQNPEPTKQSNRDTLILRKVITFYQDNPSLKEHHKTSISKIAALAVKNTSTRIIVAADVGETYSTGLRHVNDVCSYLRNECGISKDRIFIQSLPHIPAPMSATAPRGIKQRQSVEISLMKPFWSL